MPTVMVDPSGMCSSATDEAINDDLAYAEFADSPSTYYDTSSFGAYQDAYGYVSSNPVVGLFGPS
jgi:hypothetical protein